MPTKQVPILTTETIIVNANPQRTVLTLANLSSANIIYVSDEPGMTTGDGYPIFPETFISLPKIQGEEPQKKWYGIVAVNSTLAVLESFGDITQPGPSEEPDPQQPYHPQDAPKMRRI